jgi:hypothetical protein
MPKNEQWDELFIHPNDHDSIEIRGVPNGTRIVVVSDMQIPLEDRELLDTIFGTFAKWYKPEGDAEYHLFLNGDVMDNFTLSKFLPRVIPRFTVGDEIQWTHRNLSKWGTHFTHKHYVFGNHEDRWERYIFENAPQMAPFTATLAEALGLDELGYDWVPYLKHYAFEGFIITHGDVAIKHTAARMLENYHSAGTSGHANRPQSFTWADASGSDPITWYVTGMTCRRDIGDIIKDWRRIQPWQQGFLVGEVLDGVLYVELVRVHHGAFRAAGRVFKVGE